MDANILAQAHMQWRLAAYGRVIRGDENTSEDQVAAATYSDADARRLVACWNAFGDIPTDEVEEFNVEDYIIEQGTALGAKDAEIMHLKSQLAAARALLAVLADELTTEGMDETVGRIRAFLG
jgi:hypothetical protein